MKDSRPYSKEAMERDLTRIKGLPEVDGDLIMPGWRTWPEVPTKPGATTEVTAVSEYRREARNQEFERLYELRDELQGEGVTYAVLQPILNRINELNREEHEEMYPEQYA